MAKSGEIENRFNEIDNIHQGIKGMQQYDEMSRKYQMSNKQIRKVFFKIIFTDEQSSLIEKVENISDTIKELNSMLSSKEENDFQNQNATELS